MAHGMHQLQKKDEADDMALRVQIHTDSFLNTTKGASDADLSKAYRKRSLELQSVCMLIPA